MLLQQSVEPARLYVRDYRYFILHRFQLGHSFAKASGEDNLNIFVTTLVVNAINLTAELLLS